MMGPSLHEVLQATAPQSLEALALRRSLQEVRNLAWRFPARLARGARHVTTAGRTGNTRQPACASVQRSGSEGP